MDEAQKVARKFLDEVSTLTLATVSENKPWAATVFFAADKNFNLYFVSDHRTRHGRDMSSNSHVAATINPDVDNWNDVAGLQIHGKVEVVNNAGRVKALAIYLKKFPQIDALFAKPKDKQEETIATRLKAANFYRITPNFVRVIDNSRGFGYRKEFVPS
ncbi:MAG: pyridoxamine 5'-phosphate oxidase family protein [Pseudomonadota bacterium]|nr:pyridoxamine 5'-phosphate oxidase family protein [Pseudomonadota bacterium]